MTSRISHTAIDAHDSYSQSLWWAQVLGWAEHPDDPNLPEHEECLILSPVDCALADPEGNEFCVLSAPPAMT